MTSDATLAPDLLGLRAAVYRFLLEALDKPTPPRHAFLLGPEFRDALLALCDQFAVRVPDGELVPKAYRDFESQYLATFEVGLPEPPVVLLASHYLKHEPAPRIVHEHILFYNHFRISPAEESGEVADHLLNELRFLVHLDRLGERDPSAAAPFERARRDFLDRHLLRWVPEAAAAAEERQAPVLYRVLLALLTATIREDRALIEARPLSPSEGGAP